MQDKRLALEARLAASEQTHFQKMTDAQKNRDLVPLLICSCQSSTQPMQPKAVRCQPTPAPAASIMLPYAPDLPRRMLNEFISITDTGDRGLIALQGYQACVQEVVAPGP